MSKRENRENKKRGIRVYYHEISTRQRKEKILKLVFRGEKRVYKRMKIKIKNTVRSINSNTESQNTT